MTDGNHSDPFRDFRFRVSLDGILRAGFREVSGLDTATDNREGADQALTIHKLPGHKKFSNLVLKHGITNDADLRNWCVSMVDGHATVPRSGSIIRTDDEGNAVAQWDLVNVLPAKWIMSPTDSTDGEVAIDTIELTYEGLERTR